MKRRTAADESSSENTSLTAKMMAAAPGLLVRG
jgi:hypothetical protein